MTYQDSNALPGLAALPVGCFLLGALFGGLVMCAIPSSAQATHATRSPAHAIASVCASEIGLRPARYRSIARSFRTTPEAAYAAECAAIGWALRTRADRLGRPLLAHIRMFSSQVFNAGRRHRPWIAFLTPDAREPQHWPRGPSWPRHAPALRLLERVAAGVMDGSKPSPCDGPAEGWGGTIDRGRIFRMEDRGWRRAQCGPTRNTFLIPPRRVRR